MWSGWRTLTTTLTQKQTDVSWATRRHLEDWKNFQHAGTGEDMWSAGSSTRAFALEKTSCGRKNGRTLRFGLLLVPKGFSEHLSCQQWLWLLSTWKQLGVSPTAWLPESNPGYLLRWGARGPSDFRVIKYILFSILDKFLNSHSHSHFTHTYSHCYNYTMVSNRYRKIPGDKCEGGFSPPRRNNAFKKNCGKDSSPTSPNLHTEKSVSSPFLRIIHSFYGGQKHSVKIILKTFWAILWGWMLHTTWRA